MHRPRSILPLVLSLIFNWSAASAVHADEPPLHGPVNLSLARAIALARERAPEVRLAQHRVREAEAAKVGAGLIMPENPRLSFELRPSIVNAQYPDRHLGYSAALDAYFDLGGAPGARVREANMRTRSAESDASVLRFHAGLDAWRAYLAASVGSERMAALHDALRVADRVLNASNERISAGAAGDNEQMMAQLEVAQIQASIESAQRERDASLMVLRELLDMPGSAPIEVVSHTQQPPPPPPLEALVRYAENARPELAALRARVALHDATATRLEREVFPRVGAFAAYDAAPYSASFWAVGASVELPVVRRNQGPIAVNTRERESAQARLEVEGRRIGREVAAARAAYEARRAELHLLAEKAVPAAERNLELIETGWRSGRFDIFRVTAAARDLVRARSMRLDALEAAWVERIALERAAGGWPS